MDIVVVATTGQTAQPRTLLGSGSERLVRTSPVPVVTVAVDGHCGGRSEERLDRAEAVSRCISSRLIRVAVQMRPRPSIGCTGNEYQPSVSGRHRDHVGPSVDVDRSDFGQVDGVGRSDVRQKPNGLVGCAECFDGEFVGRDRSLVFDGSLDGSFGPSCLFQGVCDPGGWIVHRFPVTGQ
ncbi:hypothetical protein D8Y22_11270 [Salinadaptatus halalkaliphilus]|uniref:Uncharacterized protein n=1 Tax=Salinadaptatus halalkaliphilus TaxID=2419781 RepID=A0A4S3TKQ5_9EURY|nr:hypothetical protein D8Y22_11270 [Salinadaptatus halalkaliphilus]